MPEGSVSITISVNTRDLCINTRIYNVLSTIANQVSHTPGRTLPGRLFSSHCRI